MKLLFYAKLGHKLTGKRFLRPVLFFDVEIQLALQLKYLGVIGLLEVCQILSAVKPRTNDTN